ncbi:hypothetical protein [Ancylobacter lacus]|uniref:hypothetical protein n=1 Tax=Ancylobacter lacus TaxID=2579970 RepID=UPI001BCE0439|nr:hypothetical protein [Ancylobacter lacus]MBS7538778.1 hypothetical protein [Ancylobacter lacus]
METWSSQIEGLGREGCAANPGALLRPGLELELNRLPADIGRPFAVSVHRRGVLIGYLPKGDARLVARLCDAGGSARAFVLGLARHRALRRRSLKGVAIEIETSDAGELWSAAERAEMAGRGAVVMAAAVRRPRVSVGAPIVGALCAGLVAVGAWASMPVGEAGAIQTLHIHEIWDGGAQSAPAYGGAVFDASQDRASQDKVSQDHVPLGRFAVGDETAPQLAVQPVSFDQPADQQVVLAAGSAAVAGAALAVAEAEAGPGLPEEAVPLPLRRPARLGRRR